MNGLYIHIPFCKKVCFYCDFHFTVALKGKDRLLKAIEQEMSLRKDYLSSPTLDTVYFGGGTPSLLSIREIASLLEQIHRYYPVSDQAEITLEANPDDLNETYLKSLAALGINRLSIGIQSFSDEILTWMNRRHSAQQAIECISMCRSAGFDNFNIDLIYGVPGLSPENWEKDLDRFLAMDIPHLSAYHLTIEPKTVFGHYLKKGKIHEIPEAESIVHYNLLVDKMRQGGYEHYEVSNFCRHEAYSRHNSLYWKMGKYIGFGPSAHSYDGHTRSWNVRLNNAYCQSIEAGILPSETEFLTVKDQYHDYLLTGLRTVWGIDKSIVLERFGEKFLTHLNHELEKYQETNFIVQDGNKVVLTEAGMFVSNAILENLFFQEK